MFNISSMRSSLAFQSSGGFTPGVVLPNPFLNSFPSFNTAYNNYPQPGYGGQNGSYNSMNHSFSGWGAPGSVPPPTEPLQQRPWQPGMPVNPYPPSGMPFGGMQPSMPFINSSPYQSGFNASPWQPGMPLNNRPRGLFDGILTMPSFPSMPSMPQVGRDIASTSLFGSPAGSPTGSPIGTSPYEKFPRLGEGIPMMDKISSHKSSSSGVSIMGEGIPDLGTGINIMSKVQSSHASAGDLSALEDKINPMKRYNQAMFGNYNYR